MTTATVLRQSEVDSFRRVATHAESLDEARTSCAHGAAIAHTSTDSVQHHRLSGLRNSARVPQRLPRTVQVGKTHKVLRLVALVNLSEVFRLQ
jgi:hypothetical protein